MISDMPPQQKVVGVAGCCCCFLILLLSSIQGLHATQYALTRNTWTGVVHFEPVYYGGRHFVGFWNEYITFPATVQTIEWRNGSPLSPGVRDLSPFNVRTLDGLMVTLGVVAKYHIVQDRIPDIYKRFKDKVEEFFISTLRSELQETISQFPATQLYENRLEVDATIEAACHKVCREVLHGMLTCWRLSLLEVGLHQNIEKMNQREQVEKQNQRTMMMKRNSTLIRTDMEVLKADFDRQKVVVQAEADAAAYNITNQAESDAQNMLTKAGADALGAIQETFQTTGANPSAFDLLSYLEKLTILEDPIGPMIYGDFENVGASMHLSGTQPKQEL